MKKITAIQTEYGGYKFRSRTEARWAVYFDALGITYEYEKEGYNLGKLGRYLPDFWLPQVNMWAEVKGKPFTKKEIAKCEALAKITGNLCLFLEGSPNTLLYYATDKLDYLVTNYHGYNVEESRFFCNTGFLGEYPRPFEVDGHHDEYSRQAVGFARSARFEFGETPKKY